MKRALLAPAQSRRRKYILLAVEVGVDSIIKNRLCLENGQNINEGEVHCWLGMFSKTGGTACLKTAIQPILRPRGMEDF